MSHRVVSANQIEVSVANLGSAEADVQVEVPLTLPGGSRHAWIAAGPEWGIGSVGTVAVVSTRVAAGTPRSFETDWVLATGLTRDDVVLTLRDGGMAVQTLNLTLPFA